MKRSIGIPSFLTEYNSIWSPILASYIRVETDNSHVLDLPHKLRLLKNLRKMIDRGVIKKYGGREISLRKDETAFLEGEEALFYYQIISGSIKMVTSSPDGQEFIQGIFKANDSFGEPPLFCSFPYPSTARAMEPTELAKLPKENFFQLLKDNFDIHIKLNQILCHRLKYKSMVLSEISFYDPEHRILSLLNYLKEDATSNGKQKLVPKKSEQFLVPLTRQQLADLTGLRVETVIRTVKKMESDGKLRLVGRKIAI
jgi:CRP-like cAMP-binding protein